MKTLSFKFITFIALLTLLLTACPGKDDKTLPTVATVKIASKPGQLEIGKSIPLTATVEGTNNPSQEINWSSSNTAVATVNAGVLSALTAGNSTITATSKVDTTKSDSFVVTVTTIPATTIDVNGKVMGWSGQALFGVNVRIQDATGATKETASDTSGDFSVTNVKTPYVISAVPPPGIATYVGQTWKDVSRADPQLVLTHYGYPAEKAPDCDDPTPKMATISGNLNFNGGLYTVPAGHEAYVYYVAKGINPSPLYSNASTLVTGSNYSLSVTFDQYVCEPEMTGALIYLETDNPKGGATPFTYVKQAIVQGIKISGGTKNQDLDLEDALTQTISGSVTFPQGFPDASVESVIKVGDASVSLDFRDAKNVAGSKTYSFSLPVLTGANYRIRAHGNNGMQHSWVNSDILSPGASGINLVMPIVGGAEQPSDTIFTTTPTFKQKLITGMNYYFTRVFGASTDWSGASTTTDITIPADLPVPARLNNNASYSWYSESVINMRGVSTMDDVLDGRLVKGAYAQFLGHDNPDDTVAGAFSLTASNFTILPKP